MERHSKSRSVQIKEIENDIIQSQGCIRVIEESIKNTPTSDKRFIEPICERNNKLSMLYSLQSQVANLRMGMSRLGCIDSYQDKAPDFD